MEALAAFLPIVLLVLFIYACRGEVAKAVKDNKTKKP